MSPRPDRQRSRRHLDRIRGATCCVHGCFALSDPHHLTIAQPKARGLTAGDQWAVPLCRAHHNSLHAMGDERRWWREVARLDPLDLARSLWAETQSGQEMP